MVNDQICSVIAHGVILPRVRLVYRMTGDPLLSNLKRMSMTVARHDVSDVRSGLINSIRRKIQTG